ncbi:MAG: hypothetical protein HKN21_11290, partial [Candidatus Eisenbacteria bacterium]|nr:hypothetical protein [Candidatus Eisenbacteria bacterium]
HIAKYFANSVREDGLVTIAKGGIVFAPGSAGTIQEIFQEATQNHYGSVGVISPMVFLGREYWSETKPVYPLLSRLAKGMDYREKLALVDTGAEVMKFIRENPPSKAKDHSWSFCQAYCYS